MPSTEHNTFLVVPARDIWSKPTHIILAAVVGAVVSSFLPFASICTTKLAGSAVRAQKFSRLRRHVRWVLENFGACGGLVVAL